jgi:hypothetical protein
VALIKTTDAFKGVQAIATSFYGLGGDASIMHSMHVTWAALFAGTITIEISNLDEVALNDATVGNWVQDNAATAEVGTTAGGVWTAKTLVVTAGQVGGAFIKLPDSAHKRYRTKVICTAADALRIAACGKE